MTGTSKIYMEMDTIVSNAVYCAIICNGFVGNIYDFFMLVDY